MPKQVYLADHPTWNNARPDRAVPFVTATYRYGANSVEWRAWDDEILAIPTDGGADVWRLARHRSDVGRDGAPAQTTFWYTPRPNVSPDGRWVLFTSNWEKTLGTDPRAPAGEQARQDVFLLQLKTLEDDSEAGSRATARGHDDRPPRGTSEPRLFSDAAVVAPSDVAPVRWRTAAGTVADGVGPDRRHAEERRRVELGAHRRRTRGLRVARLPADHPQVAANRLPASG